MTEPLFVRRREFYTHALLDLAFINAVVIAFAWTLAEPPVWTSWEQEQLRVYGTAAVAATFMVGVIVLRLWPVKIGGDTAADVAIARRTRVSTLVLLSGLSMFCVAIAAVKPQLFPFAPFLAFVFIGQPLLAIARHLRKLSYETLLRESADGALTKTNVHPSAETGGRA